MKNLKKLNKNQLAKIKRMQNNCTMKNKTSVAQFGRGLGVCCGHLPAIKALQASVFGTNAQGLTCVVKPAPFFRVFLHCPVCGKLMGTCKSLRMPGNGKTKQNE